MVVAVVSTPLATFTDTTNTTSYTSSSGSPTEGDFLVCFVGVSQSATAVPTLTASANGITFTLAAETSVDSGADRQYIFIADQLVGASPGAMTVTLDLGADAASGAHIALLRVTGLTAVPTFQVGEQPDKAAATTATFDFPAATTSGNAVIAAQTTNNNVVPAAPPAGWTEAFNGGYASPTTGHQVVFSVAHASATVTWADPSGAGGASGIELIPAAGGTPATVNAVTATVSSAALAPVASGAGLTDAVTASAGITALAPAVTGAGSGLVDAVAASLSVAALAPTVSGGAASTPPAFRSSVNTTGGDITSEGALPAGVTQDDYVVAFFMHSLASATVASPPAGWTDLGADPLAADFSVKAYGRLFQTGDAAPTVTWSTSGIWAVEVVAYSSVDTTTPISDSIVEAAALANDIVLGPVTPTADDSTLVAFATADAGGSGRTWTSGSMTERVDELTGSHWHTVADEQLTGGGGTPVSRTLTIAGSAQDLAGWLIVLSPASGGGGGTPATVDAVTATLTADALAPAVSAAAQVDGSAAGVSVTAHAPAVSAGGSAQVDAVTATVSSAALAPVITAAAQVDATTATLTVAAPAPDITGGVNGGATVNAVTATITVAASAPTPSAAVGISSPAATLHATTPAPVITGGQVAQVSAATATVTVAAAAAVLSGAARAQATVALASLVGAAPVITAAARISAVPAVATLTAPAPEIIAIAIPLITTPRARLTANTHRAALSSEGGTAVLSPNRARAHLEDS